MKLLSQMTPADRQARIAKLVKDPGTRTAVPTKYLPAKYRAMRAQAQALKQPIVPGSGITNQELARQRKAAETLTFGANAEAKQQQQGRDVSGWYDDYLRELSTHRANVAATGQQAQANLTGIGQAVRGFDQQALAQQLQASTADAASRGAQVSSDVAKTGSDASSVRQALLGALQGTQNAQAANATNYADTQAHVVGPGQKLQAQAQSGQDLRDLRSKLGAFRSDYETKVKTDESKNVLAAQALGLDTQKAKADIDLKRGVDPITGRRIVKPKSASDKKTEAELAFFRKHGYWPPTGPPKKGKGKAPVSGPGSLTPAAEQKIVSQINKVYSLLSNPTTVVKDANGNTTTKASTPEAVLKQLRAQAVDPRVLDVARSLLHNKGKSVGKFGLKAAHDLGIHVTPHWKVVR